MRMAAQRAREQQVSQKELDDIEAECNERQQKYADWLKKFREDALANIHYMMDNENAVMDRGAEWSDIVKMLGEKALELRSLVETKLK